MRPNPWKHATFHEKRCGNPDRPIAVLDCSGSCHGLIGTAYDIDRILEERTTCFGELDAASASLEQHNAKPLLQKVDLLNE